MADWSTFAEAPSEAPPLGHVVNIVPVTRVARKAEKSKEELEKMRLRNRREKFTHYEEGGVVPTPDSLSYINESERFITDIAGVNKAEREAEFEKREQNFHNQRMKRAEAEEERWAAIEERHQVEQKRLEEMRDNYSYARSNKTSMPYNPINLRYDDGADGDRLRYSDETLRYRGALRAEHLQRRASSTPHNPITGEPIQRVHVPVKPAQPM